MRQGGRTVAEGGVRSVADMFPTMPDAPAPCQPRRPRVECNGCARFWAEATPTQRIQGVDRWQPVLDVAAIAWWADVCPMLSQSMPVREAA